jgi:hypothetical protein
MKNKKELRQYRPHAMLPLIDRVKKPFFTTKMPMLPACKLSVSETTHSPSLMNMSSLHKAVPDIVVDPDPHSPYGSGSRTAKSMRIHARIRIHNNVWNNFLLKGRLRHANSSGVKSYKQFGRAGQLTNSSSPCGRMKFLLES